MKTLNIPIYQCEYCPKYYKRKNAAITHEEHCSSNPLNIRACMDCQHLTKVSIRISADYDDDEMIPVHCFYCPVIKEYMYPQSIEKRGVPGYTELASTEEEISQKKMPVVCSHQLKPTSIGELFYDNL